MSHPPRGSCLAQAPDALVAAFHDRYALGRELGRGGMATVYLARDLKHGREVAVKVLRPELAALLGPERFLAEVALAARLDHPHILTLIDSGEAAGTLYYVLPYIRGESLRQRLEAEQELPVDEAVRIACQAASAMDYAHRHGVIHRDIKPENILLHEGEAMLADFGVALAVQEAAGPRLTDSGLSLGTPQYMSPEQAGGSRHLTPRSDIFSLGIVVYEMLTGELPFQGHSPQVVVARLLTDAPAAMRTVRATVPPGVETAVMRALAKVPADRFATAEAFAAALREGASPTGAISAAHVLPQRRPAPIWAWALGATIVIAAIGVAASKRGRQGSSPPREPATATTALPLVAVSPFQSAGGDTLTRAQAQALSQAIVDSLANRGGLRAVATGGDRAQDTLFRGTDLGLAVSGSIERQAGGLKAIGRVSDGVTQVQLFSQAQQLSLDSLSLMEGVLVEQLVRFVRRYVGTETRRREVAAGTGDPVARAYWTRAMAIVDVIGAPEAQSLPTATMDRLAVADSLLGQAIRRDPRWTGPYVARGWAYLASADLHGSPGQRDSARITVHRKAVDAADAALRISPADANAHELRGVALLGLWFEAPSDRADSLGREAEQDLRRAISLDLNVARAWEALGTYYLFVGRFEEGRQAMTQALEADAFLLSEPAILNHQVLLDLNLERYTEAEQKCAEGARSYPHDLSFVNCRLMIPGWAASDVESARRVWALGLSMEAQAPPAMQSDVHRNTLLMTAAILARAGERDSAAALVRAFERTRQGPVDLDGFAGDEAHVKLLLGQRDEALALLRVFLHNNWSQRGYVVNTPWYRPLHGDPRFVAMTERLP